MKFSNTLKCVCLSLGWQVSTKVRFFILNSLGLVKRFNNVLVHYQDEEGRKRRLAATGLIAAMLQHEIDHLEGTLYIDKLETMKDLAYEEEAAQYGKFIIHDQGTVKFFDR